MAARSPIWTYFLVLCVTSHLDFTEGKNIHRLVLKLLLLLFSTIMKHVQYIRWNKLNLRKLYSSRVELTMILLKANRLKNKTNIMRYTLLDAILSNIVKYCYFDRPRTDKNDLNGETK